MEHLKKIKVLFLIHDLGHGGAEKVLVNLVNNMDQTKFDISLIALFGGVNEQYLKPHIHYRAIFAKTFRGNIHIMKIFTPRQLHEQFIKERFNVEVAYLEGPSVRIISGCPNSDTKLVSWTHCTMHSIEHLARSFRSSAEAQACYNRMDALAFVAETVRSAFLKYCPYSGRSFVLYNTNESEKILELGAKDVLLPGKGFRWCGVGKVTPNKGFDRMIRIQKKLKEDGICSHLYILGNGPQQEELNRLALEYGVAEDVTFLGYQTNPYQYIAKCDLFVCASYSEGFSTAATEALIVGTPVCTVEVSGMKEMLGEHNEWGVVTENNDEALYQGIKRLLEDPVLLAHYKEKAVERGKTFSTENTVKAVEEMLLSL